MQNRHWTHSNLFNINLADETLQYSVLIISGIVMMYILWRLGNSVLSKFTANAQEGITSVTKASRARSSTK